MQQEIINGVEYRFIQQHLYIKRGDAFIHCATIPRGYGASIFRAVNWYESGIE